MSHTRVRTQPGDVYRVLQNSLVYDDRGYVQSWSHGPAIGMRGDELVLCVYSLDGGRFSCFLIPGPKLVWLLNDDLRGLE